MSNKILTVERLKENLSYNHETGLFTRLPKKTRPDLAGKIAGTTGDRGVSLIMVDGKVYLAHRLAWLYIYGEWPGKTIDHINGNPSDNRISNLREASNSENLQNQRMAKSTNKLGVLGVHKLGNSFIAQINVNGKKHHLGCFETKELAHDAYLSAKRKFHLPCTI